MRFVDAQGFGGTSCHRALQQAIRLRGLDNDESGTGLPMKFPEIAGDARRHPSHAPLQENVREGPLLVGLGLRLLDNFRRNDSVALHDIAGDVFIAFVRGIRHHLPSIGVRQTSGFVYRCVIVARDAHDFGPALCNSAFPFLADLCMQHNNAPASRIARRCRQCTAMVPVGGTDDGVIR